MSVGGRAWTELWRKAACAVLPRSVELSRRLGDGTIVGGPNRPGHGGRGVFVWGSDIEPELAALPHVLGPGGVVVDVGANSGVYSLVAARIVGDSGVVISLEPNPRMLAVLQRNVARNSYTNVRLRGLAAGSGCGSARFFENSGMPHSFSLVPGAAGTSSFSVLTVDLDTLLGWEEVTRVDLIKIDAEGSEGAVLAGARQTIARHRPVIIAELIHGGLEGIPDGYRSFRASGRAGINALLIPAGHRLETVVPHHGWTPG